MRFGATVLARARVAILLGTGPIKLFECLTKEFESDVLMSGAPQRQTFASNERTEGKKKKKERERKKKENEKREESTSTLYSRRDAGIPRATTFSYFIRTFHKIEFRSNVACFAFSRASNTFRKRSSCAVVG